MLTFAKLVIDPPIHSRILRKAGYIFLPRLDEKSAYVYEGVAPVLV